MCWNFEASVAFTVGGLITTSYMIFKKYPAELWIPLFYFTLMELLQATMFSTVGQCFSHRNQVLTVIGFLHITFQPFFINMLALHFIPQHVKAKVTPFAYALCFIAAFLILLNMYPFAWSKSCIVGKGFFCGKDICTYWGNWHLAWQMPLNTIFPRIVFNFGPLTSYDLYSVLFVIVGFWVPFLYGSWKFSIFQWFCGPIIAHMLTNNVNEYPAIWCFFSVAVTIAIVVSPLRRLLYVEKWMFYNKPENNQ